MVSKKHIATLVEPISNSFEVVQHRSVSHETMHEWINTAIESGSNYWIEHIKVVAPNMAKRSILADLFNDKPPRTWQDWTNSNEWQYESQVPFFGGHLIITADGEEYTLDLKSIAKGVKLMAWKSGHHFDMIIDESGDSITADVLLQYCLLGDVIYG